MTANFPSRTGKLFVMEMEPVISVEWLAGHLADPDLVLLDATLPPVGVVPAPDVQARYLQEHLPGAVRFDIEALSDHGTPLPHMLPSPEVFAAQMAALGVGEALQIVVYEQEAMFSAPRAWWMLRSLGAARVAVLDGGLRAWKAAGLPVETGEVTRPPAAFHAHLQPGAVRSYEEVQTAIAGEMQIVDARGVGRFQGTAPEPRPGLRSGHMPGARNVPYTEVGENGRWKSKEQLKAVFAAQGFDLNKPIITSCGSGITAAVLLLALEQSGATQVSLYDGSWAEYAQQPDAVIVRGTEEQL